MNKFKKYLNVVDLFFIVAIALAIFWVIELIFDVCLSSPHTLLNNGVFHHNINDSFNDFYFVNDFFLKYSPYVECKSSYPPMNFIICFPFMLIQRHDKYPAFVLYVIIYSLFLIGLYFLTIRKYKLSISKAIKIAIIFLISAPFLFMVERGNYLVITFCFTCLFLLTYDSKNRVIRELSFVWLAIAVASKIYPAVFAIVLLKEKRWLDLLKAASYSIVLFFLPFLVMKEGFVTNIQVFLENLKSFSSSTRLSVDVSTSNMFRIWAYIFGLDYTSSGVAIFATIIKYSLFVLMVVAMYFSNKRWKTMALAALCSIVIPSPAMIHSLIFVFIAIFDFVNEGHKEKIDYLYMALFILIITPLQFGFIIKPVPFSEQYPYIEEINPNYLGLTVNVLLEAMASFALALSISISIILEAIKNHKKNQQVVA